MTDAFDLEAAALAAEAEAAPFTFTYKGGEYTIPPQATWPVEALNDIAQGQFSDGLTKIMGQADADKLRAAGLTMKAMEILIEQAGKTQVGTPDLPNSGPPARRGSTRT
ncbi:MAG: hypothetical protein FWE35_22805 [Streptosporangiales bacterium]|nr:hypothetical protein [Streptosporangiales bacterium]